MALHEHFRDYTKKEIDKILKDVCIAHNCPYLSGLDTARPGKAQKKDILINKCCMYIVRAHKMRDCMPDECEHWKDDIKPKRSVDLDEY